MVSSEDVLPCVTGVIFYSPCRPWQPGWDGILGGCHLSCYKCHILLTMSSLAARLRWYPRRMSSRLFTSSRASLAAGRQACNVVLWKFALTPLPLTAIGRTFSYWHAISTCDSLYLFLDERNVCFHFYSLSLSRCRICNEFLTGKTYFHTIFRTFLFAVLVFYRCTI